MATNPNIKKLLPFTDDELRKELDRRFKARQAAKDRERKEVFATPSVETYMKADYYDIDRPYFTPLRKWYDENYAYKKGMGGGGGYWQDTLQRALTISMYRDVPLAEQLGILDFVPYIWEADMKLIDERGQDVTLRGKPIEIFEHTLSYHADYQLLTNEGATYVIRNNRVDRSFATLELALDYIRKKHYYQIKPGVDAPDEEDSE